MQVATEASLLLHQCDLLTLAVAGVAKALEGTEILPEKIRIVDVEFTTKRTCRPGESPTVEWVLLDVCPACFRLVGRLCQCVDEPVTSGIDDD